MAVRGGGGGRGRAVVVVVMVVVLVHRDATAQTPTAAEGRFQMHKSCGSENRLRNLIVNDPLWMRTEGGAATLFTSTTNKTCILQPHSTHLVTATISLEIHNGGSTGKEGAGKGKVLCYFPKQDLQLRKGLLKVSCLKGKGEAEAEMLGAQESPTDTTTKDHLATTLVTSITSPAGSGSSVQSPAGRALDPSFPGDTTQPTATTAGPQDTHESLMSQPTPQAQAGTETATSSLGTTKETIKTTTEAIITSATRTATKDSVTTTTQGTETESSSDSTQSVGLVTETEATTGALPDGTTLTFLGTRRTEEAEPTGTLTPPASPHQPDINKENISSLASVKLSNAQQTDDDNSDVSHDQMVYMAGAGAGVLALVLGVVAVASLAVHRRQKARAEMRQEDLFISGGYKGSAHTLTHSGSDGGRERGAYLNANVMYYSGAEPEMAESFELEERILSNSGISYSSHDIPKCLKE